LSANVVAASGLTDPADIAPYDEDRDAEKYLEDALKLATDVVNDELKEGHDWKQMLIIVLAFALARDQAFSHMSGDKRRELERQIDNRLKELQESAFEYSGPWKSDTKYRKNQFVSHRGSMWHAQIDSRGVVPGDGAMWKLAVKQGRDRERY
jgi:hypothetical protein